MRNTTLPDKATSDIRRVLLMADNKRHLMSLGRKFRRRDDLWMNFLDGGESWNLHCAFGTTNNVERQNMVYPEYD